MCSFHSYRAHSVHTPNVTSSVMSRLHVAVYAFKSTGTQHSVGWGCV